MFIIQLSDCIHRKTRRKSQSGLTYADVPDDGGYGAVSEKCSMAF
mgnify:CR=1 FL=1